jgi:hypothetical protein
LQPLLSIFQLYCGLIVFGDWIYWTSFTNNTIYRVDKEAGSKFEVVKTELSRPVGIKIYSQENQPTGNVINPV